MDNITKTNSFLLVNEDREMEIDQSALDMYFAKERIFKEAKSKREKLNEEIKKAMETLGIKKIDTDLGTITYIEASDDVRFNTKKFREKHPDVYDNYCMISPKKSSVRVKLK